MKKHAYLIIAHHEFEYLKRLLGMLDDKRNDIYILIDSKAEGYNKSELLQSCHFSKVFLCEEQIAISWGSFSLIEAEYILLKTAYKCGGYSYYHLISGNDIVLKNQDYIHAFFEKTDLEYIHFCSEEDNRLFRERYCLYYFFRESVGKTKGIKFIMERCLVHIQKWIKVDRSRKNPLVFYSGSNWFSITEKMVELAIQSEDWVKSTFKYSFCCDEVFLQTIAMNSNLKEKIAPVGNLRKIAWVKGEAYVWKEDDLEELLKCEELFARKVSQNQSGKLIENIERQLIES